MANGSTWYAENVSDLNACPSHNLRLHTLTIVTLISDSWLKPAKQKSDILISLKYKITV